MIFCLTLLIMVLVELNVLFITAGPTKDSNTETKKLNAIESEEELRALMFNKDNTPSWLTNYLNRSVIEMKCSKSKPCFASEQVVPLCGTDNQTYLNPGVFVCAQQCDKLLKVGGFGPCAGHKVPTTKTSTSRPETTTQPHESSDNRVKLGNGLQKAFRWLGFHVHEDGGVYIADEKVHDSWWNP